MRVCPHDFPLSPLPPASTLSCLSPSSPTPPPLPPGSMREVDVIDVSRQEDIRMKMREWTEYYENQRPRRKILNVISLEFSNTE